LRDFYNDASRGRGADLPREISVGRELYDAFKAELEQYERMWGINANGDLLWHGAALKAVDGGWEARVAS
jgi:hypothetical protein